MRFILICIILFFVFPVYSNDGQHSNKNKRVFFVNLSDGESVISPVTVKFGINGMSIAPAGLDKPMSGHHHLLINLENLPDMTMPIPNDKNHLHFGKGQTETIIEYQKESIHFSFCWETIYTYHMKFHSSQKKLKLSWSNSFYINMKSIAAVINPNTMTNTIS